MARMSDFSRSNADEHGWNKQWSIKGSDYPELMKLLPLVHYNESYDISGLRIHVDFEAHNDDESYAGELEREEGEDKQYYVWVMCRDQQGEESWALKMYIYE